MLRFYYIDSPPPLSVGLFFIHNHADGSYSGDGHLCRSGSFNTRLHGFLVRQARKVTEVCLIACTGGVSFTRADYSEEGSGGNLKSPEDYEAVLKELRIYPQVISHISCSGSFC